MTRLEHKFKIHQVQVNEGQTKYSSMYCINTAESMAIFLKVKTSLLIDQLTIEDQLNGNGIVGRNILASCFVDENFKQIENFQFVDFVKNNRK